MDDIRQSLKKAISHYGLSRQAEAASICSLAESVSDGQWRAVSYKNGKLKILVDSNEQAYLIKLKSAQIISQINKKIGKEMIEKLIFKVES